MKKIYGFLIALLLFAFGIKAHSQTPYIPINFVVPTDVDNVIIQDIVLNLTTTQMGVSTNISLPYYGISIGGSDLTLLYTLTPTTTPTSIANAYIVDFLPTQSYITVYNQNSYAVKGGWGIEFGDGFYITSSRTTLPPHTLTTIPLTAAMTHEKTYTNIIDDGVGSGIEIWYEDSTFD